METVPRLRRHSWGWQLIRALVVAIGFVCMVAFAVALAKVTLVPSPASVPLTHTNLHPGSSIRLYFDQPDWRDTIKQVGGNVLLGVPFGFLLPVLFPRTRGFVRVVLMTAFVMLTVEVAQGLMVTGRAFDIDDVILNATGAFLGYLFLGRTLGRALHPRRDHWWRAGPAPAETPAPAAPSASTSKKAGVKKAATKKPTAKKTAAKKPTTKKPTAKKAATKKATTKKTAAKKSATKKTPTKTTKSSTTNAKKTAAPKQSGSRLPALLRTKRP